jgi:hypothetical protein
MGVTTGADKKTSLLLSIPSAPFPPAPPRSRPPQRIHPRHSPHTIHPNFLPQCLQREPNNAQPKRLHTIHRVAHFCVLLRRRREQKWGREWGRYESYPRTRPFVLPFRLHARSNNPSNGYVSIIACSLCGGLGLNCIRMCRGVHSAFKTADRSVETCSCIYLTEARGGNKFLKFQIIFCIRVYERIANAHGVRNQSSDNITAVEMHPGVCREGSSMLTTIKSVGPHSNRRPV